MDICSELGKHLALALKIMHRHESGINVSHLTLCKEASRASYAGRQPLDCAALTIKTLAVRTHAVL